MAKDVFPWDVRTVLQDVRTVTVTRNPGIKMLQAAVTGPAKLELGKERCRLENSHQPGLARSYNMCTLYTETEKLRVFGFLSKSTFCKFWSDLEEDDAVQRILDAANAMQYGNP